MRILLCYFFLVIFLAGCGGGSSSSESAEVVETPVVEKPTKPSEPEEPVESTITLSWDAPTAREDGQTMHLYEIDHYEITVYTVDGSFIVRAPYHVTSYEFRDLPAGEYTFDIITVDIDGLRSMGSEVVSKTVQ